MKKPLVVIVLALGLAALWQGRAEAAAAVEAAGDERLILEEDAGLWQLFRKGGLVMPLILLVSIAACAFGIERAVALRPDVQVPKGLAEELVARLQRGGLQAALPLVKGKDSALARMLAAALQRHRDGRAGMGEAAGAAAARALQDMRRNVRPLNIAASVTPLMGLLGTVWGMIKAFDRVGHGGLGQGAEIAGGIAEALLTTGMGLMVAIPALLAYHYLRGKSEDLMRLAEEDTVAFINLATQPAETSEPAQPEEE